MSGTDAARMAAAQFVDAVSGFNPAGASLIHDLHNPMAFIPVASLFQRSDMAVASSRAV